MAGESKELTGGLLPAILTGTCVVMATAVAVTLGPEGKVWRITELTTLTHLTTKPTPVSESSELFGEKSKLSCALTRSPQLSSHTSFPTD